MAAVLIMLLSILATGVAAAPSSWPAHHEVARVTTKQLPPPQPGLSQGRTSPKPSRHRVFATLLTHDGVVRLPQKRKPPAPPLPPASPCTRDVAASSPPPRRPIKLPPKKRRPPSRARLPPPKSRPPPRKRRLPPRLWPRPPPSTGARPPAKAPPPPVVVQLEREDNSGSPGTSENGYIMTGGAALSDWVPGITTFYGQEYDQVDGSCGYRPLNLMQWPHWNAVALSPSNRFRLAGPMQACGWVPADVIQHMLDLKSACEPATCGFTCALVALVQTQSLITSVMTKVLHGCRQCFEVQCTPTAPYQVRSALLECGHLFFQSDSRCTFSPTCTAV